MTGLLFFDATVIAYATDPNDPGKQRVSRAIIRSALSQRRMVVSPQILNECYAVLVHKRRIAPPAEVERYLSSYHAACSAPLDVETHRSAIMLESRHRLSWWDCVALASALQARCEHFLSEDLNDGQAIESLTVVNPFAPHAPATLALT